MLVIVFCLSNENKHSDSDSSGIRPLYVKSNNKLKGSALLKLGFEWN